MLLYIEGTKVRNKTKCTPIPKCSGNPAKFIFLAIVTDWDLQLVAILGCLAFGPPVHNNFGSVQHCKLEGNVGEIVSQQAQMVPYFQLREKFKCIEHIDKG